MLEENNDSNVETFEIIIRSAMQSFSDRKVQCSGDWTILQLKEHLYKTVLIKPEVSRQRLIYAGHCLENSKTIRSILKGRADTTVNSDIIQVFHLVYSSKEALQNVLTANPKSSLRHRTNTKSSSSVGTNNATQNANENVTTNAQTTYDLNGLQYPYNPYEYYAAYYQNYLNQIMYQQQFFLQQGVVPLQYFSNFNQTSNTNQQNNLATVNNTEASAILQSPQQQFIIANANLVPYGFGNRAMPLNSNVNNSLFLTNLNNNNGIINQERNLNENTVNINGNTAEDTNRRPDLLETIYKLIRFMLLIMLIYVYASVERSILVLLTITLIWLLQRHRERRNQNEQQLQQVTQNQRNLGEQQQQQEQNENNTNANGTQETNNVSSINSLFNTSQTQTIVNRMSAWTVFWSTISSFFTSLIPENPVPVNIN